MRQFDVLANPIPRARRALPFVMILQADVIETGRDRVVARSLRAPRCRPWPAGSSRSSP